MAWNYRVATVPMDRWWSWVLLFLGEEFCYYWMHRADHRIRWMWATHAVHHSSNQFVLANAYRLGWTTQISGTALFMAPLVLVGFSPAMVLSALAANLLYQFWIHTELIGRLGPLEWVLNTPRHHRVHHSRNAAYLDRNFGGVLIVFDRLLGTFAEERADLPCRYGLVQPLTTNNPCASRSMAGASCGAKYATRAVCANTHWRCSDRRNGRLARTGANAPIARRHDLC
jgi:sterol desaturase/sphingolipid hydroxylase (fatty acid hydroxylase superfamily)